MANLAFAPQHNMIAYIEKTESNAEFHQMVDFFTSSSIHHSLTVSPIIHASNIEQFLNFATSQTINDEKQIHAIVDDKTVIFENLLLMGYKGALNKLTFQKALFSPQWKQTLEGTGFSHTKGSNFPDPSVDVEAVHKEWGDSLVRAATTVGLDAQQDTSNITKTQSKATLNEPTPQGEGSGSGPGRQETIGEGTGFSHTKGSNFPDPSVDVEAVHKEWGDSLVWAATTVGLDAQQDSSNITKTQSKATLNEPTPQGEGSGSG
nr:hypothetical protein [Tanacetum cinerariifolium]